MGNKYDSIVDNEDQLISSYEDRSLTTYNDRYQRLATSDTTNSQSSYFKSPPDLDPNDAEAHFRLYEAMRLSIFRTDGDGQPCTIDDVTRHMTHGERERLVSRKQKLSDEEVLRYRVGILAVSWSSMFVLGGLGIFTFAISVKENSNASFAFALDAFLVCLSSVVLIWRYMSCSTNNVNTFSAKKEKVSCLFLGALFYISALGVTIKSLMSLINHDEPESSELMWKVFIANAISCLGFAIAEMYLAVKLKSVSIAMDAINTGLAAVLSVSGCINDLVYLYSSVNIWYIDAVIGVICGIVIIVYATWAMAHVVFHKEEDEDIEMDTRPSSLESSWSEN